MQIYSRRETLEIVQKALLALPSRELFTGCAYAIFDLPDIAKGDCRYCVKGATLAYMGGYREEYARAGSRGKFFFSNTPGAGLLAESLNEEVLRELERIVMRRGVGRSERRAAWSAVREAVEKELGIAQCTL